MGRPREFDEAEALAAAMDVFWKHGYTGANTQDLCAAMKLNPGSLYAAYGNKQELFATALRHYLGAIAQRGIDLVETAPSGLAGIRAYFSHIIDGIDGGRRRWGCFGTNSFMEMGERDGAIEKMMSEHFRILERAFSAALMRDGMAETTARDRSRYLVCFAQGLNVLARTKPTRATLEAVVATALCSRASSKAA